MVFGSSGPRQKPDLGIIGHNCVIPEFRRNGFGKQQNCEGFNRIRSLGIKKAIGTTSEHPFFYPTQRTYISCGFQESTKYVGGPDPRYRLIEYVKNLV